MSRDTRRLLIAAAAELLDRGGPAAVTLRDVGKKAGVSHNAPYKHFASKEDLLAAVASRELSRQSDAMTALAQKRRPIDTLRALSHGYIAWAKNHPARFKLVFGAWTTGSSELGDAAGQARAQLVAIVESAQAAGELPAGNPDRIAALFLALAHGAVDLALGGHLARDSKGSADPEMLVDDLIGYLKAALEKAHRVRKNARKTRALRRP